MNLIFRNELEKGNINLTDFSCADGRSLLTKDYFYKIIWAKEAIAGLRIDGCTLDLKKDQVVFCTPLNFIEVLSNHKELISIVFNREFYCIRDNDSELSCNGLLFYGSSRPVVIDLGESEKDSFERMYQIIEEEFLLQDISQGEMLRAMLKRLLIKSTRLVKKELIEPNLPQGKIDVIRNFNVLVEKNFRTFHKVVDYADMLFKSPKTLSNTFSKFSNKTPLTKINERIILEARRLLIFSNKSIQEISHHLGYLDESHFSRFFTKHIGCTPVKFRKEALSEKIGKNLQ